MRRVLFTAALVLLLLVALALPAFAAIHDIASSECAAGSGSLVANNQAPPGQVTLGQIAQTTALAASDGTAANGNSGASVCPNK